MDALDQAIKNVGQILSGGAQAIGQDISQGVGNMENAFWGGPQASQAANQTITQGAQNIGSGIENAGYNAAQTAGNVGLGIAGSIWNPVADSINNTFASTNQALQQNRGNPLAAAGQATAGLFQNTVGNPRLLADIGSLAVGGPEAGGAVAGGLEQGLGQAVKAGIANIPKAAPYYTAAGALSGYANSQQGQGLQGALEGGIQGLASTPAFEIGGPIVGFGLKQTGLSTVASKVFGQGSALFQKAAGLIGGGDSGNNLVSNLTNKFGSDAYRMLANKELIQRVVTGQGSPEDVAQFHILNNLGQETPANAGMNPRQVPQQGAVWNFLQEMFPSSFRDGKPTGDLTDPQKTPLAAIEEMQLSPEENQALQQIDEQNPSPADQAVQKTQEELKNTQEPISKERVTAKLANGSLDNLLPQEKDWAMQNMSVSEMQNASHGLKPGAIDQADNAQAATGDLIQHQDMSGNAINVNDTVAHEINMQHPDIAQYAPALKKAIRVSTTTGEQDISRVAKEVPGLDVAVDGLKQRGIPVRNMDDLANLTQGISTKVKTSPQTAAEALAVKKGQVPNGSEDINAEQTVTPKDIQQYADDLRQPHGQNAVATLLSNATHEKPQLDNVFTQLAQDNGGEFSSRVKNLDTFIKKIVTKRRAGRQYTPFDVNDTYGARITVPDQATKTNIITQLQGLEKQTNSPFKILDAANVAKETYHATHIDLSTPAGTRIELQLDTPQEKAEALVNHPIRAQFGENPPPKINMVKKQNFNIISKLSPSQQRDLAQRVETMHKAAPETASTLPLDLSKGQQVSTQVAGNRVTFKKGQPVEVNNTHFAPDALKPIQKFMKQNLQGMQDPKFFRQNVLPERSWKQFLNNRPDFNNHEGGPAALANAKGYFSYVDPKQIVPDQANIGNVVDKRVAKQFKENQPVVLRKNPDGTFQKVDGQHRVLASQALGHPQLPAVILDDNAPTLARSYMDARRNAPAPAQPFNADNELAMAQQLQTSGQLPQTDNTVKTPSNQDLALGQLNQQRMNEVSPAARQAYTGTMDNGGATVGAKGQEPTEGYAYSPYKDTEHVVPKSQFTPKAVESYIQTHAEQLAQPGNHIGMWEEDGKVYMDISQVGAPTQDTYQRAIDAQQEAVYNLKTGETIYTPHSKQYGTEVDSTNPYREQNTTADVAGRPSGVTEQNAANVQTEGQTSPSAQNQAQVNPESAQDFEHYMNNTPFEQRFPETQEGQAAPQAAQGVHPEAPVEPQPQPNELVKEVPHTLIGSEEARAAAGLPMPPGQEKNVLYGQNGHTGDMPPLPESNAYAGVGAASHVRGGSENIPVGNAGVEQKLSKLELLQANLRPMASILSKSDNADARNFAQRVEQYHALKANLVNPAQTKLEDVIKKLSTGDYENFVDAAEGKAVAHNENVAQALNVWDGIRKDIATKAKALDLETLTPEGLVPWEARDNYFPHFTPPDVLDQIKNSKPFIDKIIKAGKASNTFEAQLYIDKLYSNLKSTRYGPLQIQRETDTPFIKNPKVLLDYVGGAYNKLAHANYFGSFGQDAQQSMNSMIAANHPYEANVAKKLYEKFSGGNFMSPEEQAVRQGANFLHNTLTPMFLGPLTALHHGTVPAAVAGRLGTINTLKASGDLLKGMFGHYSELARNNVSRLHTTDQSLYGKTTPFIDKYYKFIGLNRTLNALSAFATHAANYKLDQMQGDLNNPRWQSDMQRAGIDPTGVLQQGAFSPEQRTQYIQSALRDTSLLVQAGDMPKITEGPIGRLAFMFKAPLYQRTARLMPYLYGEMAKGNITPLIAFTVAATALGTGEQVIGNQIQNKPAPNTGKLGLQGALRGQGTIGAEEAANMIQYPQFAPQTAAGLAFGPGASAFSDLTQGAVGLQSSDPNTKLTGERSLVRNIPIVGPTAANTFLPYKSYVGNRPSDIVSAKLQGKPVLHNPDTVTGGEGSFSYNTQPSIMDMIRMNPKVQQEQKTVGNIVASENQVASGLSQADQKQLTGARATLSAAYTGGNQLDKIHAYGLFANNPNLALAQSQIEVASAKENKTTVNPLWQMGVVNPQAQKTVLQYKSLLPADQKAFKSDPNNKAVLDEYNASESQYYSSLPADKQIKQYGIVAPTPSKEVSQMLDLYGQSKASGKPNYTYLDDPRTQAYFAQLDYYDNYVNGLAGLPPSAGGSSGSGSGGYSSGGSAASDARYMDRSILRQYMLGNINNLMNKAPTSLELPKPIKSGPGSVEQFVQSGSRLPLKTTVQGISMKGGKPQVPDFSKMISIQMPKYQPLRVASGGPQTMM